MFPFLYLFWFTILSSYTGHLFALSKIKKTILHILRDSAERAEYTIVEDKVKDILRFTVKLKKLSKQEILIQYMNKLKLSFFIAFSWTLYYKLLIAACYQEHYLVAEWTFMDHVWLLFLVSHPMD